MKRPAGVILAAWTIFTLVGLLRLRNWARYSVLIIGGCLTALGIFSIAGMVLISAISASKPATANLPPHTMQLIFHALVLLMAIFCLLFYGVQIWLIERHRPAFH